MWKRILIAIIGVLMVAAGLAWFNKSAVVLFLVKRQKVDVAPAREIVWQLGPDQAAQPAGERPPNIVFILLDDFGINDLSTFGGGSLAVRYQHRISTGWPPRAPSSARPMPEPERVPRRVPC